MSRIWINTLRNQTIVSIQTSNALRHGLLIVVIRVCRTPAAPQFRLRKSELALDGARPLLWVIVSISSVFCVFSVTFALFPLPPVLSPLPPRSLTLSSSFFLLLLVLSLSRNAFGGSFIKWKLNSTKKNSLCPKLKEKEIAFGYLVKKIKRSIFFYVLFCYSVE